jgi:hypothetical protein
LREKNLNNFLLWRASVADPELISWIQIWIWISGTGSGSQDRKLVSVGNFSPVTDEGIKVDFSVHPKKKTAAKICSLFYLFYSVYLTVFLLSTSTPDRHL